MYGRRLIRAAPWPALLTSAGASSVLLVIATLAHSTSLCWPIALLGLSACGATAAYVLDEESTAVADSTPASRLRRTCWRIPIAALPVSVATISLLTLDRLDPATHWLRLIPLSWGSIAIGLALAATLRWRGSAVPGDLASVLTLATTVLVVMTNPLRHWAAVAPLGDTAGVGRSVSLWIMVVAGCAVVVLACSQDPGRLVRKAAPR